MVNRVVRAGWAVARGSGGEVRAAGSFAWNAWRIDRERQRQTVATADALARRFLAPRFAGVWVWDLVERLAQCVDPTDCRMLGASQLVHVGQVLGSMDAAGVEDADLYTAAMVHDLGKLLLLVDVEPQHVMGSTVPLGGWTVGAGLDHVRFQWGHAEYAYQRLRDLVPDHLAWLIRYHNIDVHACASAMDARDRELTRRYLVPFQHHDRRAKSAVRAPRVRIGDYRDLVEKRFPDPVDF